MPDESAGRPSPEGQPQPDDVMAMIRQMIDSRLDQRMGLVTAQMEAIERRLAQQLTDFASRMEARTAAPTAPAATDDDEEVKLPEFPPLDKGKLAGAWLMDTVSSPEKLAETAANFANAFRQVRAAFAPADDFALAREIFARNPAAIMMTAPDPLQGHLGGLLANTIQQGVRIGSTAKGGQLPAAGGGTTPLAPVVPGALPARLPAPSGTPSPSPGKTTGLASLTSALEQLSPDSQDALLAQLAVVAARRGRKAA